MPSAPPSVAGVDLRHARSRLDPVLRARVLADLGRSRTPGQIAGRLRAEANDPTLGCVSNSIDADGRTVSHEAI